MIGLNHQVEISVAIEIGEPSLMNSLALSDDLLLKLAVAISEPNEDSCLVPSSG